MAGGSESGAVRNVTHAVENTVPAVSSNGAHLGQLDDSVNNSGTDNLDTSDDSLDVHTLSTIVGRDRSAAASDFSQFASHAYSTAYASVGSNHSRDSQNENQRTA